MMTAREAAAVTLYEIIYKGAFSNLALKERIAKNRNMPENEKTLLTNLVYGVVSRHYTLLYIIEKYSSVVLNKIDKKILIVLQLGLYQLLYTDKIPDRAAVDESVKLAKKWNKYASGFVNAVLRSFIRDQKKIVYPENDKFEYLSVKYSYSCDMAKLFVENFGDRAEAVMEALNEPPRLILRANVIKNTAQELSERLERDGISADPIKETALLIAEGFDIADNILYDRGYFSVQDEAAYNAATVLDPKPGDTVIDMCAAPGGKATHIAELMSDEGSVIACDIHEHKIGLINRYAQRLGLRSVKAYISDGTQCDPDLIEKADRVLCDVPCSGLGIIRRKPDIKLKSADFRSLPQIQLEILKNGAKYVKHGGTLVYSTCTLNKHENSDVVDAFLADTSGYSKSFERLFCPDIDETDGFYICKIIRE